MVVPKNSDKSKVKVQKIAATPYQIRGQRADVVVVVDVGNMSVDRKQEIYTLACCVESIVYIGKLH